MKELLDFFTKIGKLKKMPRRGWVINQIKTPESIADHTFRATIVGWVLGKEKSGLNIEKLLKIALVHNLSKIYSGDITPYDSILAQSKKKIKEIIETWPKFSKAEREKICKKKYQREKKALEKLISKLSPSLKKEIKNLWLDYEKGLTPEGRFFNQADRMENFLQALEYWKKYKKPSLGPWQEWAKEFFDDHLLIKVKNVLERRFLNSKEDDNEIRKLTDFLTEIGRLKDIKRKGIMFYGVKDPETTAEHTFRMTLLAWILGRIDKRLNIEKVIKISLVHDLCEVYVGDITPYDGLLPEDEKERYEFVRKWPRLLKKVKEKRYTQKFKKEKQSLEKLVKKLPQGLKKEIFNLWWDYEIRSSKEGIFVHQIDRAENLLEAFDCYRRDKSFPTKPWWQHAEEVIDNPIILKFLNEISKEELKLKS